MAEESMKYLDDPQRYCERINALISQNSSEWLTVWKAAIPELSSAQCKELSKINPLLKPMESAFKSKNSNLRVQAFKGWSYFITNCEMLKDSEKLLNVVLVPLLAHNHSVYIVLSAKLKTWNILLDTSYITKDSIMKRGIPSLLRCMYGPHSLDLACNFAALSETCGQLYHKAMIKCSPFNEQIDVVLSFLEKAIPPLSNMENTQKIAKLIWSDALRIISEKEWPKNFFSYLMRTFENLISDHKNDGFQLISNFLSILVNIYGSFPPDRLTPHVNLMIRCLFHPPVNTTVITNIMSSLLKLCEDPSFFFHQLDVVLISTAESNEDDIDKLWLAVAACYKKWLRNNQVNESEAPNYDYTAACRVLLFPLNHLSKLSDDTDRFSLIMKQWKSCYEDCASSADVHSDKLIQNLAKNMETALGNTFKKDSDMIISTVKVAILFCNTILSLIKYSEGFSHLQPVLLQISENIPCLKNKPDSNMKLFAIKHVVSVLSFVKLFPAYSDNFSFVIKTFGHLVPNDMEQVVPKINTAKSDESDVELVDNPSENVVKLGNITTPLGKAKLRTSFLEKLSPANKKSDVIESLAHSPSTPKNSKISDDDIQFIEIQPKPKNSPMTEHQREKAKAKRHIPALYQDLSQSQSQSQCESISLLSGNKKSNNEIIHVELFEENANLPALDSGADKTDLTPATLSFRSGLDALTKTDKGALFSSKKSLFNDSKGSSDASDVEVVSIAPRKLTDKDNNENLPPITEISGVDDKPTVKRRTSKAVEMPAEVTPVKRSKRISSKLENTPITRSGRKSTVKDSTPRKAESRKRRTNLKVDDKLSGKEKSDEGVEIIDLIDSESQNVFVPTSASKADKMVNVSSPLNSLMNVKAGDDDGSKTRRKSLRTRKNSLPNRSPISTRKRASVAPDNVFNSKKSLFADDSTDEGKNETANDPSKPNGNASGVACKATVSEAQSSSDEPSPSKKFKPAEAEGEEGKVVVTASSTNERIEIDENPEGTGVPEVLASSETISNHQVITCVVVDETPVNKSPIDDSVVLIEEPPRDVISLGDSVCQTDEKLVSSIKTENRLDLTRNEVPSKDDVSDESTFFENTNETPNNPAAVNENVNQIASNNEEITAIDEPPKSVPINVIRSTTDEMNARENLNQSTSPEIVKSTDVSGDKEIANDPNTYTVCVNPISENTADKADSATSSVSILENASTSASNESVSILDNSCSVQTSEQIVVDESLGNSDENGKEEKQDEVAVSDIRKDENSCQDKATESDQQQNQPETVEKDAGTGKGSVNTSPIHSNSRASQLIKLVCGNNVTSRSPKQTKSNRKPDKPCFFGGSTQYLKTSSQRSSRIMKNFSFDNDQSLNITPSKIITTPVAEKLRYTPRECTSPGILKKPDANQNTSPKSPKIVNFADMLTVTREFHPDDEIDMDSLISTGDKSGNHNLLNSEDIQSQDVLYPPLQNCRDDIKNIIEFIFCSSWSQQGFDHFQRIGIYTVGQLASMSTLTATSIPAGDNRIQRLKNALKKYDEKISSMYESKGLRRPSVRRRISKSFDFDSRRFDVSCIIDLLDEGELVENEDPADANEEDVETKQTDAIDSSEALCVEETSPVEIKETEAPIDENTSNMETEIIVAPADDQEKRISIVLSRVIVPEVNTTSIEDITMETENVIETESEPIEDEKHADSAPTECHPAEPEPMDVDKESRDEPPKCTDAVNESVDYVCTGNDNENSEHSTDKRNITIKNIRRYSTFFEPHNNENSVAPAPQVAKSPEIVDEETPVNESPSIFTREEATSSENRCDESPSVITAVVDITDSDQLERVEELETVTVVESPTSSENIEQNENCSVDEIPATIDQPASSGLVRNDELINDNTDTEVSAEPFQGEGWKEGMTSIWPFFDGNDEQARTFIYAIVEKLNKAFIPRIRVEINENS